ncbi:TlpA family protein disulfide reductase [Luteimonas sp. R10]|uniref:TlpA family protein disulfide reductase n=1 Tax=Luteimonas sp. R10 TaxID=3108176 RepID=UPI003086C8AC|nr:redoxin family protein [Luteimonas sp. R10]
MLGCTLAASAHAAPVINFKEPPRTYRAILRQLRALTVTMTHDRDGAISDAYGVEAVPRLFMVDRAGRLAYTHNGYSESSIQEIAKAADRLLAQAEEPAPEATSASSGSGGGRRMW